MIDRPHWSFSSVSQYLRCPLQYYFERVARIPRPTVSSSLILGSAVHEALAMFHSGVLNGHSPELPEVQKAFVEGWSRRESCESVSFRKGESSDVLIEVGKSLLAEYLKSPTIGEILSIEHRVLVPLRDSTGTFIEEPLIAIADLIVVFEGRLKVVEFKTAAKSYNQTDVDRSLQATCYANLVMSEFDVEADVEFTVLVKTKKPKLQRLSTTRNESDFQRLGSLVEHVRQSVEAGRFFPNESPMNCSTCPFQSQCKQWPNLDGLECSSQPMGLQHSTTSKGECTSC
jgi:putative RecB family exonuclease